MLVLLNCITSECRAMHKVKKEALYSIFKKSIRKKCSCGGKGTCFCCREHIDSKIRNQISKWNKNAIATGAVSVIAGWIGYNPYLSFCAGKHQIELSDFSDWQERRLAREQLGSFFMTGVSELVRGAIGTRLGIYSGVQVGAYVLGLYVGTKSKF